MDDKHDFISQQAGELIFRQSLLNDHSSCPQMAMYRYILGIESEFSYFAAFLGTAGHAVVEKMHKEKNYEMSVFSMQRKFIREFRKAIEESDQLPQLRKGFNDVSDQMYAMLPEYIEMLKGYRDDPINQDFNSVFSEQSFVMVVENPFDNSGRSKPFIFTGQIDQGGYYNDGFFSLRDLKFRDNAFKPSKIELRLSTQGAIYAMAAKNGKPVCNNCRPHYDVHPLSGDKTLVYEGPCEDCKETEKDPILWPSRFPDYWELVWMRDYQILKRGHKGRKKGECKGDGVHRVKLDINKTEARFNDILQQCQSIREGRFYRRPSSICSSFCHWKEPCLDSIENEASKNMEIESLDLVTIDPFSDEMPLE